MEEKIAKTALSIIGSSYLIAILLLILLLFSGTSIASGDFSSLINPFMLKAYLIAVLYVSSIIVLATLSGKSTNRRLASWLYSIVFHAGLLFYLGLATKLGFAILIIGFIEVIVTILSIAGLFVVLINNKAKESI